MSPRRILFLAAVSLALAMPLAAQAPASGE
jgi:hypothetical protein